MGPAGRAVAANLRRLREARGHSLRGLSDKMRQAGRPLSADAINKIENGRPPADGGPEAGAPVRRVDADDLVALAVVLNVAPNALLLPAIWSDEQVQLTEDVSVTAKQAWLWAEGRAPASCYGSSSDMSITDDTDEASATEEAEEADYWRQREDYEALTHPPQRRRAARHSANRAATTAGASIEGLVSAVLSGNKQAAQRRLEDAELQLRQLGTEIAKIKLELKD